MLHGHAAQALLKNPDAGAAPSPAPAAPAPAPASPATAARDALAAGQPTAASASDLQVPSPRKAPSSIVLATLQAARECTLNSDCFPLHAIASLASQQCDRGCGPNGYLRALEAEQSVSSHVLMWSLEHTSIF